MSNNEFTRLRKPTAWEDQPRPTFEHELWWGVLDRAVTDIGLLDRMLCGELSPIGIFTQIIDVPAWFLESWTDIAEVGSFPWVCQALGGKHLYDALHNIYADKLTDLEVSVELFKINRRLQMCESMRRAKAKVRARKVLAS